MLPQLTAQENLRVVERTMALIRTPETWIKGEWKCPINVTKKDPATGLLVESDEQATDKAGRPLFAYCLEGAINQAIVDELGIEKAIELGAVNVYDEADFDDLRAAIITPEGEVFAVDGAGGKAVSVADVAIAHLKKFAGRLADWTLSSIKSGTAQPIPAINDAPETTHAEVIWLLRLRRDQLRDELGLPAVTS